MREIDIRNLKGEERGSGGKRGGVRGREGKWGEVRGREVSEKVKGWEKKWKSVTLAKHWNKTQLSLGFIAERAGVRERIEHVTGLLKGSAEWRRRKLCGHKALLTNFSKKKFHFTLLSLLFHFVTQIWERMVARETGWWREVKGRERWK